MSVLFLECPEEFPELVELWRKSFAETATAHPTSKAPPRTTPLNIDVIDCDDPRYDLRNGFTKAVVSTQTTPSVSATPKKTSIPNVIYYTMEDGGESEGASATSARAAKILADLVDDAPAEQRVPNHRPCHGAPAYCC